MKLNLRNFVVVTALIVFAACSATDPAPDAGEGNEATLTEAAPVATSAEIDPAPDAYKIVMLGDSLTAGFDLPPSEALPAEVERLLTADGNSVDVINAGVSGDTTAGGLARYDWSVASVDPDMLVLALGANDYLSGIDPDQTKDNLTAIIERALADELAVLLVSVSARSSAASDPRAAVFAEIYPALAETYDVALYSGLVEPIFDQPDLLMQDGLHPTADGVRIIAAPLSAAINELLDES